MIEQRTYGANHDLTFSEICFGTMRMCDSSDNVGLLERLYELGVDTHHSSHEYDSHANYLARLKVAKHSNRHFKHIVKISNPHFGDTGFDAKKFEQLIDHELTTLGAETLHNVQWLLRSQPINDQDRLEVLQRDLDQIEEAFQSLTSSGKVQSFSSFPYSLSFATEVLKLPSITGLTTYLNLIETEYSSLASDNCPLIAIRPLAAGKLKNEYISGLDTPQKQSFADFMGDVDRSLMTAHDSLMQMAIRFPLLNPNVVSAIVSVRNIEQGEQVCQLVALTPPKIETFNGVQTASERLPDFTAC